MKLNISNILTLARIIIIPIIVICIYLKGPFYGWIAFILFCLASITDYFDGYIARIRNEITNFGTFLDPIADKLLVAAVILVLTSKEIIADFPDGIDYLITGVGTGGHISGVAEILKKKFPNLKVLAVEPEASPVISGGEAGPHPLQGIGAGFIPKNLNTSILDGAIQVSKDEAFTQAKELAIKEGVLAGISTGAALAAVSKQLKTIKPDSIILTFNS